MVGADRLNAAAIGTYGLLSNKLCLPRQSLPRPHPPAESRGGGRGWNDPTHPPPVHIFHLSGASERIDSSENLVGSCVRQGWSVCPKQMDLRRVQAVCKINTLLDTSAALSTVQPSKKRNVYSNEGHQGVKVIVHIVGAPPVPYGLYHCGQNCHCNWEVWSSHGPALYVTRRAWIS